ncbi:hypothetical protein F4825DRAFT_382070 [Nemania diffusa]|nr:hypothetical protein F4825DRAFT_382070 [Nemania diffusa]
MLVGVTVGRSRSRNAARLVLPIAFLLLENIVSTVLKGACAGPMRSVEFGILSANKSAEHIMLMGGTYQSVATVDVCLVARETPTTSVYQAATTPLGSHPHPSIGGRHPSVSHAGPAFGLFTSADLLDLVMLYGSLLQASAYLETTYWSNFHEYLGSLLDATPY